MLLFSASRIENSVERPVAAGQVISAEGAALMSAYSSGVFGARLSAGASTDKFLGVSINRTISQTQEPVMEQLTVASGTVTLKAAAVVGSLRVVPAGGSAYTVATGAPSGATEAQHTSGAPSTVTFYSTGENGKVVTVTYLTDRTVAQQIMSQGNQDAGGPAGLYLGQIGIITKGDIYTDQFVTTVDWAATPLDLRLGASGKFTIGGSGSLVPGYILQIPTVTSPVLGIHINAD